jgi:hypothetical protein
VLKIPYFVQFKLVDRLTFAMADLTAQFTLDCSVCCVLKAETNLARLACAVKTEGKTVRVWGP